MTATPEELAAQLSEGKPLTAASGVCGGEGQMSCEEAEQLIQLYLDRAVAGSELLGEGTSEVVVQVTEHLGLCPPCESEFAVYQRISLALSRCRPDLPPDTRQRLERFCSDLCSGSDDTPA